VLRRITIRSTTMRTKGVVSGNVGKGSVLFRRLAAVQCDVSIHT